MPTERCAIWGTNLDDYLRTGDAEVFTGPRTGGSYRLTGSAKAALEEDLRYRNPLFLARLTTWIVDQNRAGVQAPTINGEVLEQIRNRRSMRFSERKARFFLLLSVA